MDYLRQIDPKNPHPILICLNQEEMLIGRHTVAALANFHQVSRYHACFTKENGSWYVKDLGSEYNLYVNFSKVGRSNIKLELGDIIGFGTATVCGDGGFACVLKRQDENSLINCQQTFAPCLGSEGPDSGFSSTTSLQLLDHPPNPIKREASCSPGPSKTVAGVFDLNRIKNEINGDNYREVTPLTPPKQSPVYIKRDIPSPCSTIAENARSSDGYSSDASLEIVYDAKSVIRLPSCYQSAGREFKRESSSDCSTATVPASPNFCTKELDSSSGMSLKIENVFHCKEMEDDNEVFPQDWGENPANSCETGGPLSFVDTFTQCCVKLLRCDSKHFKWPHDVKKFNVSKRLDELARYPQTVPLRYGYASEDDTSSSSETVVEAGNLQKGTKLLCLSRNLKVQVKNNKIVSTDSGETDDNTESSSSSESPSEVTTESELLENVERPLPSTKLERSSSISSGEGRCVVVPRQRTRSKKSLKRLKKSHDDDTDSSVSSHSEIIYPSFDVIKRIENATPPAKTPDSFGVALSNSERKTAGRTLLIEPKPITRRPGKLRGREEWFEERCTGAKSESVPNPVGDTIAPDATSKSSGNDAGPAKKCVKVSKDVGLPQKSKAALQSRLKKMEIANVPSIKSGLEKTASLKSRKKAVFRKRPLSLGSRMGFLTTMESNASKETESKKNNSQSQTKKRDIVPEPRISKTQTLGNVTQAGSNRVEGNNGNCIAFESTKQTFNKPSNEDNLDLSSLSFPGNFLMQIEPNQVKAVKNSIAVESSFRASSKPSDKGELSASAVSSNGSSITGADSSHVNAVGSTKLPPSKSLIRDNLHVLSVSTPAVTTSVTSQVKPAPRESPKQKSSKPSNGDNRSSSTVSTPSNSVTPAQSKQVQALRNFIAVESRKRISSKPSNKVEATAPTVSTPKTKISDSKGDSKRKKVEGKKCNRSPSGTDRKKVAVVSPMKRHSAEDNRQTTVKRLLSKLLIEKIVQWNPKWLGEQTENENPPPEVVDGALPLPLTFKSYDNYVSFFHPMIVLDVWQSLFQKYLEIFPNKNGKWNNFYFRVIRTESNRHDPMLEMHCQALVNENVSYPPTKGDVVLLNTTGSKPEVENCIFAYIYRNSIEDFKRSKRNIERWSSVVPYKWFSVAKLYRFSVYVKKGRKLPENICINIGHGIQNIKDKMMLADALESFRASPLLESIVCPTMDAFFVPDPDSSKSGSQQIVDETGAVERGQQDSPVKLVLLHGPPGTGKTETAVRLIEELSGNPLSKVLVCASCDPALDEIAHRLMRANNPLVKFVRIGTWPGIRMNLYGETLYRKTYDLICKERERLETRIRDTQDSINEVLFSDGGTNYRNQVDEDTLQVLMAKYKRLTEQGSAGSNIPKRTLERQVIDECNVVLATPKTVLPDLLGVKFTCCIVDAATQCTELELMPCLMPSIGKLVLLGDCGQLPPQVNSKFALMSGYGRSLFERLCLFFKEHYKVVPFLTLKEQYRMRPELCRFPFTYFYNEALVTAPLRPPSALRPFILYDVMTDGMICYNDLRPAQVIAHMCRCLLEIDPNLSIGVIGNTVHELMEYQKVLADRSLPSAEVNWLENFQGREKDVMIVPYFRHSAQSDKSWACGRKLNVTITRARQCLIILGHASYLMHYKHWNDFIDDAKRWNNYIGVAFFRDIPFIFSSTIAAHQAAY